MSDSLIAVMDQRPSVEVPTRSPLYLRGDANGHGLSIRENALAAQLVIRGKANDPSFAQGVQTATGLALPGTLHSNANDDWRLRWLTPDEWLLTGPADAAFSMEAKLREQLSGHYAVINVSGGQTLLQLSGANAKTVLMKSCPYDVHDRNFPVGKVVSTVFAKSQATLCRLGDDTWELVIRRSFADYIWRWLLDAGAEFGLSEQA
ncbi:sarcosine oxidase subunit gamma [Saccharospirillum mangrovi]|uniref:sarcosine oxidase subunit gamma n=1 Tax=Saccharospirillum mangrovi TaxID=2161747 RepID=UPI000D36F1D5|nr:sarcosine oxidase subunit gamma family protein [Saccharospirillum mangrovi]